MCFCTVDYPHCTKWISVLLQRKKKSLFSKEKNKKVSNSCVVNIILPWPNKTQKICVAKYIKTVINFYLHLLLRTYVF
jgi:hypothetical protein